MQVKDAPANGAATRPTDVQVVFTAVETFICMWFRWIIVQKFAEKSVLVSETKHS